MRSWEDPRPYLLGLLPPQEGTWLTAWFPPDARVCPEADPPPGMPGTRGHLGCEESPSQDRVGLTLTSSRLSPPEVQTGCAGATVYAWGVEKLDKIGLLTPTAKELFLRGGVGAASFGGGARVCQDPLVTVSEQGRLPGVLCVEVEGSGVPTPESRARLALSSCVRAR